VFLIFFSPPHDGSSVRRNRTSGTYAELIFSPPHDGSSVRRNRTSGTYAELMVLAVSLSGCGSVTSTLGAASAPVGGQVTIDVKAESNVELWQLAPSPARVCVAPCKASVDANGTFEARVMEMPDSPPFALGGAPTIELQVSPAPAVLPSLGVVTSVVGGAGMAIGGTFAIVDVAGDSPDFEGAAMPGGLTVLAGSAVLAAGIVMYALSGTRVTLSPPTPPTVASW
jgi:hypothetical protein